MKMLKTCLIGFLIIFTTTSHAAWTSDEGHKIKSLDSGFDGKFYVQLDGFEDINCPTGVLLDMDDGDSHDEDDQSFDVMFTMLLSAFHSATMVRVEINDACRGSRVQLVN